MKAFTIGIADAIGFRPAEVLKGRGNAIDGLYRRSEQQERLTKAAVKGTLGDIASIREQAR